MHVKINVEVKCTKQIEIDVSKEDLLILKKDNVVLNSLEDVYNKIAYVAEIDNVDDILSIDIIS